MRLTHLDLQVSWQPKPEGKAFRFGKKQLTDVREKVGSEGNDNSHTYVTHVHVCLHKTTADVYLNICLSQQSQSKPVESVQL